MTPPAPESFYQQLRQICHFLETNRIPYMVVGGIAVSIWTVPRATVDADDDYKRESLRRAVVLKWEGQDIKVASPEDVILLKLLSGRGQDHVDVENIIQMQKASLDKNYLHGWAERLSLSKSLNQFFGK